MMLVDQRSTANNIAKASPTNNDNGEEETETIIFIGAGLTGLALSLGLTATANNNDHNLDHNENPRNSPSPRHHRRRHRHVVDVLERRKDFLQTAGATFGLHPAGMKALHELHVQPRCKNCNKKALSFQVVMADSCYPGTRFAIPC